MKRLLVLLLLFLSGRTGLAEMSPHLTSNQAKEAVENAVIDQARKRVLSSGLVNDAQEIELVRNTKPTLFYIYFGKPIADYRIRWLVNSKESIVVYGRGNILTLEGAYIERRN